MAFDYAGARKAGFTDAQIAVFLAQENKFDLAAAQKAGYSPQQVIAFLAPQTGAPPTPVPGTPAPPAPAAPAPAAPPVTVPKEEPGEFAKGIKLGWEALKGVPGGAAQSASGIAASQNKELLKTYAAIDAGTYKPGPRPASMVEAPIYAEAQKYLKASPQERAALRKEREATYQYLTKKVRENLTEAAAKAKELQPYQPKVGELTDVENLGGLRDWAAFTAGQAIPNLGAVLGTLALTKSGKAAAALTTSMAYSENVNDRVNFMLQQTEGLPEKERAAAIADYLRKSNDVNATVAIASGAAEVLVGPAGTLLKRQILKELGEETVARTIKEAAKAGVKRAPGEIAEETVTGGAQEALKIAGERKLGEQQGDVLSAENAKRLINAAAAEGLGGAVGAGAITTADITRAGITQVRDKRTAKLADTEVNELTSAYKDLFQARVDAIMAEQPGISIPEAAKLAEQEAPQILKAARESIVDRRVTEARSNIPEGGFDPDTIDDALYMIDTHLEDNQERYGITPDQVASELKQRAAETLAANPDLSVNVALNEASRYLATQTQAAPATEPEVAPGFVRVYHSGIAGEGETGRWVSTNRNYAASYRPDLPLYYTDIPADDPRVNNPDYADQGVGQGFTFNFELTPEEATQLQEIPREISTREATPATQQTPTPAPAAGAAPITPPVTPPVAGTTPVPPPAPAPDVTAATSPEVDNLPDPLPGESFDDYVSRIETERQTATEEQREPVVDEAVAREIAMIDGAISDIFEQRAENAYEGEDPETKEDYERQLAELNARKAELEQLASQATTTGKTTRPSGPPTLTLVPSETIPSEVTQALEEGTPQDVIENLDSYARSEAQDRDLEPSVFTDAARDAVEGRVLETDEEIADVFGADNVDTYRAGAQWGQDRVADTQPATEQAAPEVQEQLNFAPEIAPESDQKTNTETERLIKQVFPEGPPPKPTQPSFLNVGPTVGNRIENMVAMLSRVPSLSRRVQKLLGYYQSGYLSAEQFVQEIEDLNEYVARMRNIKQYRKATTPRVRGADFIRQKILEAKRRGILTEEGANLTEWFILQNPALVDDLGISIERPSKKNDARGEYRPLSRIMFLFKGAVDDITPVHEILHHLERLMPFNIQEAIRKSWINATKRAAKRASTPDEKTYFDALRAYHNDTGFTVNGVDYTPEAARNLAVYMVANDMVPFGHYQYFDASEFWAVNATDIVAGRYDVRGSVLGKLKQWLRELAEKVKGIFGLPSQAPILRALRSLSKADGLYQSSNMLSDGAVPLLNPKVTPEEVIAANPKLTQAQIDSALRAAGLKEEKISGFEKKILRSTTATQMNTSIPGLIAAARNFNDALQLAKALYDSISPTVSRAILPLATSNFVTRWVEDRLPAIRGIEKALTAMDKYRNRAFQVIDEQVDKWVKFSKEFRKAAKMLEDVIMLTNFYGVDPTKARTAQAYMLVDGRIKRLRERLNQPDVDKGAIERLIERRKNQILDVYNTHTDKAGNTVYGWNALTKAKGGAQAVQIFAMARDAYKKSFNDYYEGYLDRVDRLGLNDEDAAKARAAVEKLFAPIRSNEIYFPLMRFGDYWLVVGKGSNREFYTFESATARNLFRQKIAKQNPKIYLNQGDNIQQLRDDMLENDPAATAIKEVFDALGKDNPDMEILKDQLFQMYLMALPNNDMRQRFAHRKFTTGFSTDALRVFAATQRAAASQITRFIHTPNVEAAVAATRDQLNNYDPVEKTKLAPFVDTMEERSKKEVSPATGSFLDTISRFGAKGVFIWMLAGVSNAVVEFSQILYVVPHLMQNYPIHKVMGKFLKYLAGIMPLGGFTLERRSNDGELMSRFNIPSMKDSFLHNQLKKTNPELAEDLAYGWEEGAMSGVYGQTFAGDAATLAKTPSEELGVIEALRRGDVGSALMQATLLGVNLMTTPYRTLSSMSKQIGYMVAFELAYEKALKAGKPREQARQLAAEQALEDTRTALLVQPERDTPPALQGPIARLATQFTMFQYRYIALLYRPLLRMLSLNKSMDLKTRAAAAKAFVGNSILAASLYGTTGFAGYGLIIKMFEALFDEDDDEDKDKAKKYAADDPRHPTNRADLDGWYREIYLPQTFGPDGNLASVFNMDEKTAKLVKRSAEIGPLSAATGINFYSSLSLGKFWTNDDIKGDTDTALLKDAFYNYFAGPIGSLVENAIDGINSIQKGDTRRGMEALVPKGIRGFVKEQRFSEEGVLSKDGKQLFKNTYLTPTKKVLTALGFNDLEISMIQEQNYRLSRWEKRIEKRKADLLTQYKFAKDATLRDSKDPEKAARLKAIRAKMTQFDLDYPSYKFDFSELTEGDWQRIKERASSQQGLTRENKLPAARKVRAERAAEKLATMRAEGQ